MLPVHYSSSLRPFRFVHACAFLFPWTVELLAFASRLLAPRTMDLSVRFVHSHFVRFFLVSERSGRPPAERSEAPCVHMQSVSQTYVVDPHPAIQQCTRYRIQQYSE